jgi:hypothetical protein
MTGLYQYFIRVIPTIYTNEYGHQTYTNQYTITDRFRPLALPTAGDNKVCAFRSSITRHRDFGCAFSISPYTGDFVPSRSVYSFMRSLRKPSCRASSSCTSCRPS